MRNFRWASLCRLDERTRCKFGTLVGLTLLAGCVSTPATNTESVPGDIPLILNRNERVTELLDGVVVGGGEIVAVGDGAILHSDDSGRSWEKSRADTTAVLTGVSFASDAQHGWAVDHEALILASSDGGQTWQQQWQGDNKDDWFLDVCALDERRAIAIGSGGLYLMTVDGGATWTRRKLTDRDSRLNRITRGPSGTLYIAGEHGTMLRSTNDGATWVPLPSPDPKTLYGILPLGPHTLLAYGANMSGQFYRSENDGQTWSAAMVAKDVLIVTALRMRDGSILVASTPGGWRNPLSGSFFVSRDGGRSFRPWGRKIADVIELLQAPDGSVLSFGPEGATSITR